MMWKCPKCGSQNLLVTVSVVAKLVQYTDNYETEADNYETEADNDHEWDGESSMTCVNCGHRGVSREFEET